ncbi:MAG: hypothetical protein B6A08_12400 [Sorangiineae bacterium NIC37A_2]|nr:MAG: hypothetical protein B6A08_12400 [Sorangiineae bacterium NIC37A_2]
MSIKSLFPQATLILVALGGSVSACRSESSEATKDAAPIAPKSTLDVDLNDPNLAFVWVDKEGNFQTTTDRNEIPDGSKDPVRILGLSEGNIDPSRVIVTNLAAGGDKAKARTMSRDEWESQGKALRQARVDAARPRPVQREEVQEGALSAIIYGASWCKPCHMAEEYLKMKGVRVTMKDIEEEPGANAEMRQKLSSAGLSGASIPVLDVGGTILVGFSTSAVDRALERALKK